MNSLDWIIYFIVFIFVIGHGLISIKINKAKEEYPEKSITNQLVINFIITFVIALATFMINYSQGKQLGRMENVGIETKDTVDATKKLADQIKTLQEINNSIDSNTGKLTEVSNRLLKNIDSTTTENSKENALTGDFLFDFGKPIFDTSTISITYGTIRGVNTVKPIKGKWYTGTNFIVFSDGFIPITFDVVDKKLVMSLKVYDLNGDLIVDIDKNYWHRYANNTGQFNYNSKGFEIFDKKGNLVFNVDLISNNKIIMQGYLIERGRNFIMVGGKQYTVPWSWGNAPTESELYNIISSTPMKQLYRYVGKNWLGRRL